MWEVVRLHRNAYVRALIRGALTGGKREERIHTDGPQVIITVSTHSDQVR